MLGARIETACAPVVDRRETCGVVDAIFRDLPLLRAVVVVDDDMRPLGLVSRNEFLLQLSQRFGRALYENRSISNLMDSAPLVVRESIEFEDFVLTAFMADQHDIQDCFILTDDEGRYRGISTGRDVMSALLNVQKGLLAELSESQSSLVSANQRLQYEVSERRAAESAAIDASYRDHLTGLPNRRPMMDTLEKLIGDEVPFCLIFADLDGFKILNDVHGHLAGDEALRVVATRIRDYCPDAISARFGGDEFAIILPKPLCAETPEAFATALHASMTLPFSVDGHRLRVGASLGIALFPDHTPRPNELLQSADMAMLRAKREGGGVRLFDRALDAGCRDRRAQVNALTMALNRQDIVPHFQPLFDLQTLQPVMHEVLARWPNEREPLSRPDHFIPLAEREGLVDDLFWQVFSKACFKRRQSGSALPLAFNVSACQLQSSQFPDRLLAEIDRQGLCSSDIEVEVTETAMIANEKTAAGALQKLRKAGLSIALDDFGTGFSSLSLLHKFPFTKIKIDHSFVRRLAIEQRSLDIVASTILMADRLGLDTVAEGVEDEETLQRLAGIGCKMVQGYLLGRPQAEPIVTGQLTEMRQAV